MSDNEKNMRIIGGVLAGCPINTEHIDIPDGVRELRDNLFDERFGSSGAGLDPIYSRLRSVRLPDSVGRIGRRAFYSCKNLEDINIPDNITVGGAAFPEKLIGIRDVYRIAAGCVLCGYSGKAQRLVIPKDITAISDDILDPLSVSGKKIYNNITEIVPEKGNTNFIYTDGMLLTKRGDILLYCSKYCREAVIPEGVRHIYKRAFAGCQNLTKVVFPDSLRSIDENAFDSCISLEDIYLPDGLESICGNSVFWKCSSIKSIRFPLTLKSLPSWTIEYTYPLESITIGSFKADTPFDSGYHYNADNTISDLYHMISKEDFSELEAAEFPNEDIDDLLNTIFISFIAAYVSEKKNDTADKFILANYDKLFKGYIKDEEIVIKLMRSRSFMPALGEIDKYINYALANGWNQMYIILVNYKNENSCYGTQEELKL